MLAARMVFIGCVTYQEEKKKGLSLLRRANKSGGYVRFLDSTFLDSQ